MTTKSDIADLPVVSNIVFAKIADDMGHGVSRSFAVFRWRKRDYTLLGRMAWHNMMVVDGGLLRIARKRHRVHARIMVHPRFLAVTFDVYVPEPLKGQRLIFAGFDPRFLIDLALFADEEDRLCSYNPDPEICDGPPPRIPKPPAGQIV